jgi:hypothetical protein
LVAQVPNFTYRTIRGNQPSDRSWGCEDAVIFALVSPQTMRAAQILTAATMAAWILAGFFPRRRFWLRPAILLLYLCGIIGFVLYVMLGDARAATSA